MATLYFDKLSDAQRQEFKRLLEVMGKEYETNGQCTHIAFPEYTGEVVLAYPLSDGMRFVAVISPAERSYMEEHGQVNEGVDECYLESSDSELEDGISTSMSLF